MMPWLVTCDEDGLVRHAPFDTRAEANTWAWWGHICTASHRVEKVAINAAQWERLVTLHSRYDVPFDHRNFVPAFDLPEGWINGWVGGDERKLYVGVSSEGEAAS